MYGQPYGQAYGQQNNPSLYGQPEMGQPAYFGGHPNNAYYGQPVVGQPVYHQQNDAFAN